MGAVIPEGSCAAPLRSGHRHRGAHENTMTNAAPSPVARVGALLCGDHEVHAKGARRLA